MKREIIFGLVILIMFVFCTLQRPISDTLEAQGFKKIPQILEKKDIDQIKDFIKTKHYKKVYQYIHNTNVLSKIRTILPPEIAAEYIFQDYSYLILKSRVHTCHRDNNGTFFNPNQTFPSYTIIFYLEDIGAGLDVIPGSHHCKHFFITNSTVPINVQTGDAVLFDANLIHSGSIHPYDSIRVQMKISHQTDISTLSFYQNFHKVLEKPNASSSYSLYLHKWISCHLPLFSDLFMEQEDKQNWRGSTESENIGSLQKIFSYFVYGDPNYYDIPNV